jgi:hypothetical protein
MSHLTAFDFERNPKLPNTLPLDKSQGAGAPTSIISVVCYPHVTMPPRKSDVSKAGTGDEATAAKEALVRDGINIEVCNSHHPTSCQVQSVRLYVSCLRLMARMLIKLIGSQSTEEHCH